MNDISSNVAVLQTQVNGLVQSQQDYTNNVTSSNSELSTSYNDSSDNTDTSNTNTDTSNTDSNTS